MLKSVKNNCKIPKPFGIEINVHPTFGVVFLLLALNFYLVSQQLLLDPGPSLLAVLFWSALSSVTVLLSLIAHEFGHMLVARKVGVPCDRMTLFLFGGAAELKGESKKPGHEFAIAVAGPLVSVAIASIFLTLWLALPTTYLEVGGHTYLSSIFSLYLASVMFLNIVIILFNLTPAFPLDGGRMYYSVMWKIFGFKVGVNITFGTAAILFSAITFMGLTMMFGFEYPFFGTGILGGLWIIFLSGLLMLMVGLQYLEYMGRNFTHPNELPEDYDASKSINDFKLSLAEKGFLTGKL